MVRRAVVVVVVIGVAAVLGCSDDGGAVREAEELALAALLTEGDLPAGDWEVAEFDAEQLREVAPPVGGVSLDECGEGAESGMYDEALAVQTRNLVSGGPGPDAITADSVGVGMIVGVFASEEALVQAMDADQRAMRVVWLGEECQETLSLRSAAAGFEARVEEPRYGLPDADGTRVTTSTGASEMTIETHFFVRGRVVGVYGAFNGDSGEIDHQALLEAFAARVVAAQE